MDTTLDYSKRVSIYCLPLQKKKKVKRIKLQKSVKFQDSWSAYQILISVSWIVQKSARLKNNVSITLNMK